jgi:hypothetical protein
MQAIQCATINAAELLGQSEQLGSVEGGKLADIIAVASDPRKDEGWCGLQRPMNKSRLEAFSDGVLAIIITIMVLELKVPHGVELAALKPLLPSS